MMLAARIARVAPRAAPARNLTQVSSEARRYSFAHAADDIMGRSPTEREPAGRPAAGPSPLSLPPPLSPPLPRVCVCLSVSVFLSVHARARSLSLCLCISVCPSLLSLSPVSLFLCVCVCVCVCVCACSPFPCLGYLGISLPARAVCVGVGVSDRRECWYRSRRQPEGDAQPRQGARRRGAHRETYAHARAHTATYTVRDRETGRTGGRGRCRGKAQRQGQGRTWQHGGSRGEKARARARS